LSLLGKLFKKKTETHEEPAPAEPVELKNAPFNLNDTLRDTANILSLDAQEKNISIIYRMKKDVPSSVIGDRYKLSRLLTDLIGNAIDFTDKREDVIVQISRNADNEEAVELHFEVIDYGVGIAEETVQTVLMPLLTGDSPASAYGIKGRGLQRARDIIHAMQGSIRVTSRPKKGSRFLFHLCLNAPDLKEKRHYRLPNKDGVGLRTLVVDNDIGSAKAVAPMLEYFRHEVTIGNTADLAFMDSYDLVMVSSEYWSDELYKEIRRLGDACPKVVMIESMIRRQDVEEHALEYVEWLIYKPFTQQFVYEMLTALYSDALHHAPEGEAGPAEDQAKPGPSEAVEAFLGGRAPMLKNGGETGENCICGKSAHQFFVAAEGLERHNRDYAAFVEKLKEVIWKYVKADRVVAGMIDQGQLGETAEYCERMKTVLAELGVYKLACLADLLENACRVRHEEDIAALNAAFTYVLKQTISSLDQFIDQSKYKVR